MRTGNARKLSAVVVAALAGAGLGASPALAGTGTSARSAFHHTVIASHIAPSGVVQPAASAGDDFAVSPASTCYSQNGSDTHGDNAGIDAASYALSFDCATKSWKMSTTTVNAFANSSLGGFALDMETDGNFTNHCEGADLQVIGGWTGSSLVAQVRTIIDCDNVSPISNVTISRPSTSSVQITFSNAAIGNLTTFQWYMTLSKFGASTADFMPDGDATPTAAHFLPTGFTAGPALTVNADADKVVSGDFNGDGKSDVLYWGAGTKADYLRLGSTGGTFTSGPSLSVGGASSNSVAGDFNGDGRDDIFYYAKGTSPDFLRLGQADGTFSNGPGSAINGYFDAVVPGDFNGDTVSDLFFYGKGTKADQLKLGTLSGVFTTGPALTINTAFSALAGGDVNGDGRTDVLFYGSGTAPDAVKLGQTNGTFTLGPSLSVNGVYPQVVMGDFDGDTFADVAYYSPGTTPDALRYGTAGSTFVTKTTFSVDGTFVMVAGDFNGDGRSDLLEYGKGTAPDHLSLGHVPS